jgi:hypothetical protein
MGFPNVDIFLVNRIVARFQAIQPDPTEVVADLFEDLDDQTKAEISLYITRLRVTKDLKERGEESQRYLYVLPHFPLADHPFPQVGISLGTEDTAEKFIGDYTGEAVEVKDKTGVTIGWDVVKGYFASAAWDIDVVCATKDEAIWISRFVQLFTLEALDDLDIVGVKQVSVALKDMRLVSDSVMQPNTVFNRGVKVTAGMVANTWKKRVPVQTYGTGTNTGLNL